jgi:hypothetical protein
MLSLEIEADHGPAPPADPADPAVTVWHDNDGKVGAYGHTVDGDHWLHLPGLVSFRFGPAHDGITALPEPSAPEALVLDAYRRVALPMALQALGGEVLHSSAVLTPRGVVALCAVSTVGKSTLAYALSGRGHRLWADDAVAFEVRDDGAVALPLPFDISLRPASRAFFERQHGLRADRAPSDNGRGELPAESAPLAALCILERIPSGETGGPVELRRLAPDDGFRAALAHAYCFDLRDGERKRAMVREYLALADRVPILELRFEGRLENLPAMIGCVEDAVDLPRTAPT